MTSITSTTRQTRLTRMTRLDRMTSYKARLYLKGRSGFLSFLFRVVISGVIIPVRLVFLEILLILFSGMDISPG